MKNNDVGDFGLPRRPITRKQVVGIFDLVGFTDLASNKDLNHAVQTMESELTYVLNEEYNWDERTRGGVEKVTNHILLRSTGDGYVVAFSQSIGVLTALQHLADVHNGIREHCAVRLGVNYGDNWIVEDLNERVNVIGWGINLAARALQFAESNQIIVTQYVAGPLIEGDKAMVAVLKDLGMKKVKRTLVHLFNYHKRSMFGAPLCASQKE